jgi:hypothetical protein
MININSSSPSPETWLSRIWTKFRLLFVKDFKIKFLKGSVFGVHVLDSMVAFIALMDTELGIDS